jgi:hypothetical protein
VYTIIINTQDTSGAPTHAASFTLTLAQDFRVTSSTASQTVTAGQTSGPYALRILPVGASFTGAVSLACTAGLPAQAQCSFSPSGAVTPGNSAVDVVMSISTKADKASVGWMSGRIWVLYAMWLLPGIVIAGSARKNRAGKWLGRVGGLALFLPIVVLCLSCSGASTGGGGGGNPPPNPVTYHVTVTGTSPGTATDPGQSTTVTLIVN